ncbi:MAG: SpoIID/LytB domain-containing protein [Muribaculaceae bacterium]|nr:SpoIID/LytB domain-containing protein [Muribaculaceae bacterium]
MRMTNEPTIRVGIMERDRVAFTLGGHYTLQGSADIMPSNAETAVWRSDSGVAWEGGEAAELHFIPADNDAWFELADVTIGVNFHWERSERQRFRGALRIFPHPDMPDRLIAVNEVGVEQYLKSVISSEMSANASEALLMAHAVMSRSWLLRQLGNMAATEHSGTRQDNGNVSGSTEIIRWYDRENHPYYDVCADDHCQRYQGITRQTTSTVERAVELTRGQVLTYGGEIADARFHKCCGGVTELFENCWEPVNHPYLQRVEDTLPGESRPLCDTYDATVLRQVLNGYDRESNDFFRWNVTYSAEELAELLKRRSGIDFGEIERIVPLERGASGRIVRLLVQGTRQSVTVGKELEIRRWLSPSHLRSSWFDVSRTPAGEWRFDGRGWGHGAGLCQIGAAVMGARGFSFRQILAHYFPGTSIETAY